MSFRCNLFLMNLPKREQLFYSFKSLIIHVNRFFYSEKTHKRKQEAESDNRKKQNFLSDLPEESFVYKGKIQIETDGAFIELDKESFEKYIKDYKPYLNSKLTMKEMANDLKTNRSYLSSFINRTYNMNFSTFMNLCRFKEYDCLIKSIKGQTLSNLELMMMSGFGSSRNFIRVQKKIEALDKCFFY